MRGSVLVASLMALAGSSVSLAQPVIDGAKDALYGPAKWVQTVPTSWGDNRADLCASVGNRVTFAFNNSNTGGVGGGSGVFDSNDPQYAAAAAVTTGLELRIPLSQLGNPAGALRLAGYVGNNFGHYTSNQFVGGFNLPAGSSRGNLGGNGTGGFINSLAGVNLSDESNAPGNQYLTLPASSGALASVPTIDGTLDASFYGAPLFVQNVQTGFGNATDGGNYNNGSELDAVYARIGTADVGDGPQNYLFLFIAGNTQGNFADNFSGNRIQLFFDNGDAAGVNQIPTGGFPIPGLNGSEGLKFDTAFKATHAFSIAGGYQTSAGDYRVQGIYARLVGGASGGAIGVGPASTAVVGVGSACPPDPVISLGSELDAVYSYLDRNTRTLYVMAAGNYKENEYLQLFFDVNGNPAGDEGQNVLRGQGSFSPGGITRNVSINIANEGAGSLNRMGFNGVSALKFDAGFSADYALNTHIENGTRHVIDAAVVRTNGRRETPSFGALDYGSFHGRDIPAVLNFDGSNFCCQNTGDNQFPNGLAYTDGTISDVYSAFAPREAGRVLQGYADSNAGAYPSSIAVWTDWLGVTNNGNPAAPQALRPRSGLIQARIDNSNVLGVTTTGGTGASATHGFEVAIKLDELGWNTRSRIRIAGFLVRSEFTQVGNQIIGDPAGTADLGDPRLIDFSAIPGNQYVQVSGCLADYNGQNDVDLLDIFAFLGDWFNGNPQANYNGDANSVGDLLDIFAFLSDWFAGPCL